MSNLAKKTKTALQRSLQTHIYLREKEMAHIKQFLLSRDHILHICGNPGTGKTSTVLFVLKNRKYTYTNYLEDANTAKNCSKSIERMIYSAKNKIIVIDEFEKLYEDNKNVCLKLFDYAEEKNKKMITISNSLTINDNIYYFDAYTPAEIKTIVKAKINDEIGQKIVEDKLIDLIARKHGNIGDIRKVFDYVKDLLNDKNDGETLVVADIIDKADKKDTTNFHDNIIANLVAKKTTANRIEMYKLYYSECNKLNIQPLDRNDFYVILEMHK